MVINNTRATIKSAIERIRCRPILIRTVLGVSGRSTRPRTIAESEAGEVRPLSSIVREPIYLAGARMPGYPLLSDEVFPN